MDMTQSIVPKSDQLNADDLMTGPITVTISKVSAGSAEQPVDVHLVEFPGRAFRPSKSMRRVMVAAWGPETDVYAGHRMTLYRDPTIRFGRDEVGGIRISHLSHIDKTLKIALTVTRGKREAFTVEPLSESAPKLVAPSPESEPDDLWPDTQITTTEADLVRSRADLGARRESVITEKQLGLIGALMKQLGMDKESAIAFVKSKIGREVASSSELSSFEASKVITALKEGKE